MPQSQALYRFLALCARAECSADHYEQLAREASQLRAWEPLSAQAEAQGMAPLLYTHLKAAGIQPPRAVKRELQGLYLRHRQANRVRMRVLRDILAAYEAAGVQALVLKGAALVHLVYPEPGLRPMSDLDILVPGYQLRRAQRLLAELGFDAPSPAGPTPPHRHLAAATLQSEGVTVQVEIHHKLLSDYVDHALSYARSLLTRRASRALPSEPGRDNDHTWTALDGLTTLPQPFALADRTAYTLGYEDTLGHVCRHLISHVNAWESGRLIWVADVVSLAERFASQIDWARVRRCHPVVLDTLSLLHFMTPLSDELLGRADVKIGRAPQGIGVVFRGWPQARSVNWRARGYRRVLCDTFCPSEWWLRLRYARGSARPLYWQRWGRHPLYILGHVARVFLERLGWPKINELGQRINR
jgi:hypothetical protein